MKMGVEALRRVLSTHQGEDLKAEQVWQYLCRDFQVQSEKFRAKISAFFKCASRGIDIRQLSQRPLSSLGRLLNSNRIFMSYYQAFASCYPAEQHTVPGIDK